MVLEIWPGPEKIFYKHLFNTTGYKGLRGSPKASLLVNEDNLSTINMGRDAGREQGV